MCMKQLINLSTKCVAENSTSFQTLISHCNSIIRASTEKGCSQSALLDYQRFQVSLSIKPDRGTFWCVLEACKMSSNVKVASETHGKIIKSGIELDNCLGSSLFAVYMAGNCLWEAHQLFENIPELSSNIVCANLLIMGYSRSGKFRLSKSIFKKMPSKDEVSWNSIIGGSVKNNRPKEALSLFNHMLNSGIQPNGFTYASVLSACAKVGALSCGEQVHIMIIEQGVDLNFILAAALIDMYSKCGQIKTAIDMFNVVGRDNVSVWNSMITGLAIHGLGFNALELFGLMDKENVRPDSITFVGILSACSHCGMVKEGRIFFDIMRYCYEMEPVLEHYGALVDLLSRAGFLEEAYITIKEMPVEPDIVMWRSLLSACRTYKNSRLGETVINHMIELNSGDYVLLSNIYSSDRQWSCAERVRLLMKNERVKKDCGLSWVEINGILHQFSAGDNRHLESEGIYRVLDTLIMRVRREGFVSVTDLVLMDVAQEEREENLKHHSEKLALAYAILKTSPGTQVRISKNLRTCEDCHNFMQIVSRVLHRVIVVRDRARFHEFERGSCSCRDYW